ncbi:MAG: hypothetical protein IPM39_21435 [Chloroflexi bacterium]|nr:hypothetical protein [Chloroflexota bacterium]
MMTKLLMRWNIRPETESEYYEFLVHEFMPGMNKLGIDEIQVWYTTYGTCEQKLASGIAPSADKMKVALRSTAWKELHDKLQTYVTDFNLKIVSANRGFQI